MTAPDRVWLDDPRHGVTTNVYVEEEAPNPSAVQYVRIDVHGAALMGAVNAGISLAGEVERLREALAECGRAGCPTARALSGGSRTRASLRIANGRLVAELEKARAGRSFVLGVLLALVSSLPRCDLCRKPATRAWARGSGRWCDDHRFAGSLDPLEPEEAPEYPRANPIRQALAMLEAEGIAL